MLILIPTLKSLEEISGLVSEIERTAKGATILASYRHESASCNRNICLDLAEINTGEICIMLDDDMAGFFPGWDTKLIGPLLMNELLCAVSARLILSDGKAAPNCSDNYDLSKPLIEVEFGSLSVMPTACFAFRNFGLRFDENFRGSGFEDNDFFRQYQAKNPAWKFAINNECRLIHRNEKKYQSENWAFNMNYYKKKWGIK